MVLSHKMEAVANLVSSKLPRGYPATRGRKMAESRICHDRQPSGPADGVAEVEILEIAVAVENVVEEVLREDFTAEDGGG